MTRLASFLRNNVEQILENWETFARSLPQGASMNVAALRDHATEMLDDIARQLDEPEQRTEEANRQADAGDQTASAAKEHGEGRARGGFTVAEMVAEFRALRVSVFRLWSNQQREFDDVDLRDSIRFNEAIDQAIAESVTRYTREINESRDRFLAILGHDLKSPLSAIAMSASFIIDEAKLQEPARGLVIRIAASAKTMNELIGTLIDFARTRFGAGIPIEPRPTDVETVVREVVAEVSASYPESDVQVEVTGDLNGVYDSDRLAQALTNLIANAVQHGSTRSAIEVAAVGGPKQIVISVQNHGLVIPEAQLRGLFDATVRDAGDAAYRGDHLGLGLYIVQSIVEAHGGSVDATSSADDGTTFTVRLPRTPQRAAEAALT
jgi:signal transduction histidine kinase